MDFFYPTSDTFNIDYDEWCRAYVTLNGKRLGLRNAYIESEWNYDCVVRLQFELVQLCEPLPTSKPRRSWSRSMGLRRPS